MPWKGVEDPAMAFSPKELIPLWINTLETEKIAPWIPAGIPIITREELNTLEITVAIATPATPK